METSEKIELLGKQLRTKETLEEIPRLEQELEKALRAQALLRSIRGQYLPTPYGDSEAVKDYIASLRPPEEKDGKKLTVQEKEAWLRLQRKNDKELYDMLNIQRATDFEMENLQIAVELAREKLSNARVILGIRKAQMEFLAER